MLGKYIAASIVIFAFLALLRFVQDSPIRSWKTVILTAIPLTVIACYYISCAFLAAPPPQPRSQKVASNQAELLRTLRHIDGVDSATITNGVIDVNFAQDKPIAELKQIARHSGGAAAYFLQIDGKSHITMNMTVKGQKRYQMDYDLQRGVTDEQEF